MARSVQFRRGTTAQHENFIGAPGEVTVNVDLNTLCVHDGTTPGGTILARAGDLSQIDGTQISHNAALSDTVQQLSLAPDTRWTAPNDGYIFICGTSSGANQGLWLALRTTADTAIGYDDAFSSAANQKLTVKLPIAAGQKIFYSVSSGLSGISITYVKTKGDS